MLLGVFHRTYRRIMSASSSGVKHLVLLRPCTCRLCVPLKCCKLVTQSHSITFQKMWIISNTTVKLPESQISQ
jgi:hypothetical protein